MYDFISTLLGEEEVPLATAPTSPGWGGPSYGAVGPGTSPAAAQPFAGLYDAIWGAPAEGGGVGTVPAAGGGRKKGAGFCNQRDNEFDEEGCNSDNQCTPTSATMAILGRMSRSAFYARAAELLSRPAAELKGEQPEDLVVEWIYMHDSEHSGSDVRGSSANVEAAIEAWTGESAGAVTGGSNRERLESAALPAVVGTWLTSSGHTVTLMQVTGAGIVINDPYGSAISKGNYLRHGSGGERPPAHRWSRRNDLAAADTSKPREDWGRANFYTWDEVEEYGIGKWVVAGE